jgi:hypothetical protein
MAIAFGAGMNTLSCMYPRRSRRESCCKSNSQRPYRRFGRVEYASTHFYPAPGTGLLMQLGLIKSRLICRVYQPKLSPLEDHCPALDSAPSATPLGGRCARQCASVCSVALRAHRRAQTWYSSSIVLRAPVGTGGFSCVLSGWRFLMVTWAFKLSLIPTATVAACQWAL